ncbi:MAG: glycosyltransferase [Candidatus Onthomonas sp.]
MPKRVLFLIPNLAHGGAERVLVNLVNNMDPSRFEVTVQTLFDVGVNRQYLKPHVRYLPGQKRQFRGNSHLIKLFSPEALYRYYVKGEYDIVVSYLEGPTARIAAGCTDSSVKKAGWLHIELNSPRLASRGFCSPAEAKKYYNRFDRLVAVSDSVRTCFLKNLPVSVPIDVLYNTNETEQILRLSEYPPRDDRFPETEPVPRLCSVAKLMKTKGFDRLLNVHVRLLQEGFPHKIYILGIGEEEKKLKSKIREYGAEHSFILLGFQENPYQYVSRCDLYVCSSRREGFSTAVTEALILGTPVVSTDCSGARELLGHHDEYGLVVENSEAGIYQGMKRMLSEPGLLAHYRAQAKERGKSFSREKTVKAVEDMLESL